MILQNMKILYPQNTSYVCGECLHVFSTMVEIAAHDCTINGGGAFMSQDESQYHEQIIHEEKNSGETFISVCLLLHLFIYWLVGCFCIFITNQEIYV